jgi:hypothetical protein
MASTLQNTIKFLSDFGFFDVIVPFLLFFAITFAILEKTKILGKDKSNVNLIVSLAVSLLAIATNKVVNLISNVLPNLILMLVLFVMFIMILGLFFKETKEGFGFKEKHPGWFGFFIFLLFVITILFILNAWQTDNGTALEVIGSAISNGSSGELIGGIILLVIVVGAVFLVINSGKRGRNGRSSEDD